MTTKEILDLMDHRYACSLISHTLYILNIKYHRVNQAHKDRMVLQVTLDQRVTQVMMENLDMMAILANLEMMVNLEDALMYEESLRHLVTVENLESQ